MQFLPRTSLTLLVSLAFYTVWSQQTELWEKTAGGGRADIFYDVIETFSGDLVAVGESRSKSEGRNDFYIASFVDEDKNPRLEKRLGRSRDDGAYGVAESWDGGFVIVGYTESYEGSETFKGQRDPIILKIDEKFRDVWIREDYGTRGFDQCKAIVRHPDQGFVVSGQKDGQLWVLRIDETGERIWEYIWDQRAYSIGNAVTILGDGSIAVTGAGGFNDDVESHDMVYLRLDANGTPIASRVYSNTPKIEDWISGEDLIELDNGEIVVTGVVFIKRYENDIGIVILTADGDVLRDKAYGDLNQDGGYGVAVDYTGNLYVCGNYFYNVGRRIKGWVTHIEAASLEPVRGWKNNKNIIGGSGMHNVTGITHMSDGSMVMCGFATRSFKSKEGWLMKLEPDMPERTSDATSLDLRNISFADPDGNGVLTAGERGYVSIQVENTSQVDAYGVKVTSEVDAPGVYWLSDIAVGRVRAGESRKVTIPVYGRDSIAQGTSIFDIKLFDGSSVVEADVETLDFSHDVKPYPVLQVRYPEFTGPSGENFYRGDQVALTLNIENHGIATAGGVHVYYEIPYTVATYNERNVNIGDLPVDGRRRLTFNFEPRFVHFADTVEVRVKVIDSTATYTVDTLLKLPLSETKIVRREHRVLSADWAGLRDTAFSIVDPTMGLRASFVSNKPIEEDSIHIFVNDELVRGLDATLTRVVQDTADPHYTYMFTSLVDLDPGENRIQIKASTVDGTNATKVIHVEYDSIRPNLHILSIGVSLRDIKQYGANDARSFIEAFSESASQFFDSVYVTELTGYRQTFHTDIRPAFNALKRKYYSDEILPDDLLLVFISSHATTTTPGTFKIKAANYNGFTPDLTSVDFIDDIEHYLKQLSCHKVVFLDVFNQIAIQDEVEDEEAGEDAPELSTDFVGMIRDNKITTPVVLSCSEGQSSYEDESYEKGIFAEAIYNVLSGDTRQSADADKNNVISMQELYDAIRNMAGEIARRDKQTPFMYEQQLKDNIEIVHVKSYGSD